MTEESKTKLKAAVSEASKGTIRGGGSTVAWGTVVWYVMVERWHLLVPKGGVPDTGTLVVVGIIASVLTGFFRVMEQRYPNSFWSTILFSQGAPTYDGNTQQQQPTVTTVTTNNAQVTITDPAVPPPADPAAAVAAIDAPPPAPPDSPFAVGDPEIPPAVIAPPPPAPVVSVDTINIGTPLTALDDPESLDTSATPVVTDPDDLLDGGDH